MAQYDGMTEMYKNESDMKQRLEQLKSGVVAGEQAPVAPAAPGPHRARPLTEVADNLIEAITNTAGRYKIGIRNVDWVTRGVGPGELMFLTGRSYSGKTNVFINSIFHNLDRQIVVITMDEPAEHVLAKLYSIETNESFEDVERLVETRDIEAQARLRDVAEILNNVLVFDDVYSFGGMDIALQRARDYFGEEPSVVFLDYLGLLSGDSDDAFGSIENKARALKRWAQGNAVPVICVHQGSRGNAGKGKGPSMEMMAYGGENEAFHVIGVRRKRDDDSLPAHERLRHEDTVSVSVIKSKRLPMRRGEWDYALDWKTGKIGIEVDGLTEPVIEVPGMKLFVQACLDTMVEDPKTADAVKTLGLG